MDFKQFWSLMYSPLGILFPAPINLNNYGSVQQSTKECCLFKNPCLTLLFPSSELNKTLQLMVCKVSVTTLTLQTIGWSVYLHKTCACYHCQSWQDLKKRTWESKIQDSQLWVLWSSSKTLWKEFWGYKLKYIPLKKTVNFLDPVTNAYSMLLFCSCKCFILPLRYVFILPLAPQIIVFKTWVFLLR